MKIGLSTYSLDRVIERGDMTLPEVIDWAAKQGAECVELVPFAYRFDDPATGNIDLEYIRTVKRRAADAGVALCNYSVLADLCKQGEAFEREVGRLCHEVDIAAELGVPRMRHDVGAFRRPTDVDDLKVFEASLPYITEGARRVTEYAAARGVRTMIENHGFFANGCDRVRRIIASVGHDNYGLLFDTGNIACVDEDAYAAALALAPMAEMIHLKDFYIRAKNPGDATQFDCAGSWFRSRAGKYLRGSILAQGDLDMYGILSVIKRSGYAGCVAIEFEGMEDAAYASSVSLKNARRILDEV